MTAPSDPARTGYIFDGWYTQAAGGNRFDVNTAITGDVTLYAHWNVDPDAPADTSYTVTFDSNGGSAVAAQTVRGQMNVTRPADPEKENCAFIGWYNGSGYSMPYNFDAPVEQDLTLYAKWFDETDQTDSDGDGLTDALEREFGCDPIKADSDDDGLPDSMELDWLNYDPSAADSDLNGIPDTDEDPDGDEDGNCIAPGPQIGKRRDMAPTRSAPIPTAIIFPIMTK